MLPDYLKFTPNAIAKSEKCVVNGNVRFTVITSRLIRIEQGVFYDEASQSVLNRSFDNAHFTTYERDGILHIDTEHLTLCYKIGEELNEDSLNITLLSKPYTRWNFGDIALHNLGGTVSTLDRVSGACKLGDGVCSIEGYSTIDDSSTALFDSEGWFRTRDGDNTDLYFFGYGHDYITCVRDYCRLTGEVEMLPAYALGNWWSRYHRYSEESYLRLMDNFKEKDIPLSVAVIDMDWHLVHNLQDDYWNNASESDRLSLGYGIGWTGYTWNKELFPNPSHFLDELHARGLKASLNLHPSGGIRFWEEQYEDMAQAMGIDPETKQAVPFDCLNPDFLKAYFEIIHFPMENDGVDLWWMDWQQGCSYNWIHQYGIDKNELEIISPLWMLNHIHHLAAKRNGKRGLIFSRFCGIGSGRYPVGFSGDTYVAWESLDFQPYFTITASNIGYGWWSHDIGGHCGGDRDDELHTRWVQFGVFSPIFRLHSSASAFLGREPWNFGAEHEQIISDYMRLRHQLFPYLYTMNYRSYKEQLPLMLPMYYTHPECRDAYNVKNQYWFGDQLLVCPITRKADSESCLGYSDVWLPEGLWIDWFNGYVYKGDIMFECYRKLDHMPVFLKAGGIVPMQQHTPQGNTLGYSDALEIVIAAGNNGSFTMFEDDGQSEAYKSGDGAFTQFNLKWHGDRAEFTICPTSGNLSLVPKKREYKLIFKGFSKNCEFFIGNIKQKSEYDEKTNSYTVCIGTVSTTAGAIVTVCREGELLHDNSDYLKRCFNIVIHSQTTQAIKNKLYYDYAEKYSKNIPRRVPEPIGENRSTKAFYELAIQQIKKE